MTDFPALYGEATNGKVKQWSIRVFDRSSRGVIETTHGYKDGKMQVNEKEITHGKNIGKKNETSAIEQAISEARSAWTKKKESGYTPLNSINEYTDDEIVVSGEGRSKGVSLDAPSVMLAHDFNKRGKDITFPCFVSPKVDGVRCVAVPGKGLFSRLKKEFPHMNHIREEIDKLHHGLILDGELYSHELTFQEIVGLVKRETLKKGDLEKMTKIKLHVFDIINDMPYSGRLVNMQMLFKKYKFKNLDLLRVDECENIDRMKELHSNYVSDGYEGLMLRNKEGKYTGSRSNSLQKFKEFFDAEYNVVNYTCGVGLEDGCVIWICNTPEGKTFNVRPRGSREERQTMFIKGDRYVGKSLTVRYQEMTDSNIPRFPVGICFRDYE